MVELQTQTSRESCCHACSWLRISRLDLGLKISSQDQMSVAEIESGALAPHSF